MSGGQTEGLKVDTEVELMLKLRLCLILGGLDIVANAEVNTLASTCSFIFEEVHISFQGYVQMFEAYIFMKVPTESQTA